MTNDLNTETGCMQEAIDKLESNLATMGVSASYNTHDGYFRLLDKILEINSGILIDTSISIQSNYYHIAQNETIIITGKLSANYDSIGDMSGFISGSSVKIYVDNNLLDTIQTDNYGIFTKEISLSSLGTYTIKAVYDGEDTIYNNSESSSINIVVGIDTSLNINTPALIYSDAFSVTGILLDTNNNPINNATVKLIWNDGTDHETTASTNNNGEVTFSRSAPTSITEYTFQLVYDGNSTYGYATSSVISKVVDKETSILNVITPVNNVGLYTDGSLTVSGSLVDNDGDAIGNASILVQQNNSTLTTLTTGNDGGFSASINGSNLNSDVITIIYMGDDNYTVSYINKMIVLNTPTLSLTSDKLQLLLTNNESATLSATYVGAEIIGKNISFDIIDSNNDLIENIDIVQTNDNGVAILSFTPEDVGDIYIRASYNNIYSQTITIDVVAVYYEYNRTDLTGISSTPVQAEGSNVSSIYVRNDGVIVCPNGRYSSCIFPITKLNELFGVKNFKISLNIFSNDYDATVGLGLVDSTGFNRIFFFVNQFHGLATGGSGDYRYQWIKLVLEITSNKMITGYWYDSNGNLILSSTADWSAVPNSNNNFGLLSGYNRSGEYCFYDNIKIEPL